MTDIKFLFLGLTVIENKLRYSEYHSMAFNALCLWGGIKRFKETETQNSVNNFCPFK